jgi:DNA repair protein RecN (Recombination protein N)
VLAGLGGVWRRVSELAALDPQFGGYLEARDGIKSQLEDLSQFLRRYADGIEASPARLQQVEERLALLERLKRKHGPALADVIARRDALRREVMEHDRGEERIAELAQAHAAARDGYLQAARALSDARRRVSSDFSSRLEQLLGELAMERTRFEVRFLGTLPESEWGPRGTDEATFFVSPNPGEDLRPLARIVSGGELSRIMLAIKTLSATTRHRRDAALESATHGASREPSDWRQEETPLSRPHSMAPGLIFDEVDAGIGGRVADVVGRRLHALGAAFQVLCITHLPQIAACADTHFSIEKRIEDGRTRTTVSKLDAAGRVEEIGRMLGGAAVTDGIRASAREMITARHAGTGAGGEAKAKAKGESERAKGA